MRSETSRGGGPVESGSRGEGSGPTGDKRAVGMDIGGSHVSVAAVEAATGRVIPESETHCDVDAGGSAEAILARWCEAARRSFEAAGGRVVGLGVAAPGPFEYNAGISLIRGLGKYENLYGVDVRAALKERLELSSDFPVVFRNDAQCFLVGEHWQGAARGRNAALGLTLGTGIGSAFLRNGRIVEDDPCAPPGGHLYVAPFRGATAEEYFSTRAIVARYAERGGRATGVKDIAEQCAEADVTARETLADFGGALAEFLDPWIRGFGPECLVIGGNVARAWDWFVPNLEAELAARGIGIVICRSLLYERAALLGAARLAAGAETTLTHG